MCNKGSRKASHVPEVTQPAVPGHGIFEVINFWVIPTACTHTLCHMSIPPEHLLMDSSMERIRGRCRSGKRKGHMAFGAASPGHPGQQSRGPSALPTLARLHAPRPEPHSPLASRRGDPGILGQLSQKREGRWRTDWPFAPNQGRFSSSQKLALSLPDPQSPHSLAEP